MTTIRVAVEIGAPPEQVWSAIEPIERHVEWMADAAAIRFTGEQTRGTGTRFVCDTRIGPLAVQDRMEVTEWEPGRRMGVQHAGVVAGTGAFDLEPLAGARTRFTWTETLRFPWYLGGRLGAAIAGPLVMRPLWRRNLRRLRDLVEAGAGPPRTST